MKKRSEQTSHPSGETPRGLEQREGILYVVSTPIGNLEDITLRALRVLKEVNLIAAENVSRTKGLCEHYGIKTRLTSFHQHNQKSKGPELVNKLKSGADVALVTDAGTPGISDPGAVLIHTALEQGIRVSPIPGPSAVIAALSVSGLPTEQFVFLGFLPNRSAKRRKELRKWASETRTMVFFEAPHRIKATLADLKEVFGDRQMVMLREMTKAFEEIKRGKISAISDHLLLESVRGELTLVVAGKKKREQVFLALSTATENRVESLIRQRKGTIRDIAAQISSEEGLPYRQVYKAVLERKKALEAAEKEKVREGPPSMEQVRTLRICNDLGLHARAAAKIVELGKEFQSTLYLRKDAHQVDGASILSILTLSCPKGTELEARIVGEDSEAFMEKLAALFDQRFGENR